MLDDYKDMEEPKPSGDSTEDVTGTGTAGVRVCRPNIDSTTRMNATYRRRATSEPLQLFENAGFHVGPKAGGTP